MRVNISKHNLSYILYVNMQTSGVEGISTKNVSVEKFECVKINVDV